MFGFGGYEQEQPYKIKHKVERYPRPAEDDEVTFEGLGAIVYAPAGKGPEVLAAVLAEIERNAPKPE